MGSYGSGIEVALYFLPRQARIGFYFGVILSSVTYGMLAEFGALVVKYFSQT